MPEQALDRTQCNGGASLLKLALGRKPKKTGDEMAAPRMKYWGWGFDDGNDPDDMAAKEAYAKNLAGNYGVDGIKPLTRPGIDEFGISKPRVKPPKTIEHLFSEDPTERLARSVGKSFGDYARVFTRQFENVSDLVACPETEEDVISILDWADENNVAVIPYGGGSSVCGGVEPAVGDSYAAAISLDMGLMNKVLEIDRTSRAARIQAGVFGPDLENQLRPHGLTLRHFPQSFQYSTLGGWIATRSGGHYASLYTHIDDLIEGMRVVTPNGVAETRRLPGSGAGPSPDRMFLGSEGILGVITEGWMRLQDRPTFRASTTVEFEDFYQGAEALRALSQSWLFPSNCRLIDATEAAGISDGKHAVMILGFEGADHPVEPWMDRALELVSDHGGTYNTEVMEKKESNKEGAAGQWRNTFMQGGYGRDLGVACGSIGDTFETSITWDKFPDYHATLMERTRNIIKEVTGHDGRVTCRFTHVYPDGPAPYFSFGGLGTTDGMLDQWREIKLETMRGVSENGGTVTHHHAVGRDHRPGYTRQVPDVVLGAIQGAKSRVDPNGIMNPGVLIDPEGRDVGQRGSIEVSL